MAHVVTWRYCAPDLCAAREGGGPRDRRDGSEYGRVSGTVAPVVAPGWTAIGSGGERIASPSRSPCSWWRCRSTTVVMGRAAYGAGLRTEAAEHASLQRVAGPRPGPDGLWYPIVQVSWRLADGTTRTAASANVDANGHTRLWIDRSGEMSSPSRTRTVADTVLAACGRRWRRRLADLLMRRLNRRRDRLWDEGRAAADARRSPPHHRPDQR